MSYEVRDRRIDPYFRVQNVILDKYAKSIGSAGVLVYVALCRRAGANPYAWPDLRDICELTGLGMTTVRDAIVRLELVGLVVVGQRVDGVEGQRGNVYTLIEPSPEGPPKQWAEGFPKDAREYRNAPRPERPVVELPKPLRITGKRETPTPHRHTVGGSPPSGGGATVTRRGGHRHAVGLPIEEETVKRETSKKGETQSIEEETPTKFPSEAYRKLKAAVECIEAGTLVPEWLRLTGEDLEQLADRSAARGLLKKYQKGVAA